MYTSKILDVSKATYANGEEFLDVEVGVFIEFENTESPGEVQEKRVDIRKFAFKVTDSPKEIKVAIKKFIDLYNKEAEMAIEDGKKQEKNKKIDETISNLKGE